MGHYVEASLSEKIEWYLLNVIDEKELVRIHNIFAGKNDGIYLVEEFDETIKKLGISPSTLVQSVRRGKYDPYDYWFRFDENGILETFSSHLGLHGVYTDSIAEMVLKHREHFAELINSAIEQYDGEYDKYVEDEAV